jgi:hypothetical protein
MRKNLTTSEPPVLSKFEERNYLPPVLDSQRQSTTLEKSQYPSTPDKHKSNYSISSQDNRGPLEQK